MHSYNMYHSTMYPVVMNNLKEELSAPDEIMKKLIKDGTVKDEEETQVTKLFEKKLKQILKDNTSAHKNEDDQSCARHPKADQHEPKMKEVVV